MDTYSSISEAIYYATHTETDEEIVSEVKPINIKFDVKFLIDQALDNRDFEMVKWLINL
jgi:hypothetical protein